MTCGSWEPEGRTTWEGRIESIGCCFHPESVPFLSWHKDTLGASVAPSARCVWGAFPPHLALSSSPDSLVPEVWDEDPDRDGILGSARNGVRSHRLTQMVRQLLPVQLSLKSPTEGEVSIWC